MSKCDTATPGKDLGEETEVYVANLLRDEKENTIIDELLRRIEKMRKEFRFEIAAQTQTISELKRERSGLIQQLDDFKKGLGLKEQDLLAKIDQLEADLEGLEFVELENQELKQRIEELEAKLSKAKKTSANESEDPEKNAELRQKLKDAEKTIAKLEKEVKELSEKLEEIEKTLTTANLEIEGLNKKVKQLKDRNKMLEAENTKLIGENDELQEKLAEANALLERINPELLSIYKLANSFTDEKTKGLVDKFITTWEALKEYPKNRKTKDELLNLMEKIIDQIEDTAQNMIFDVMFTNMNRIFRFI